MVGGVQVALLTGLAARLYYLQFIESQEYQTLSESNRIKLSLIPPARGVLLDRNSVPLAVNTPTYQLVLDVDGLSGKAVKNLLKSISMRLLPKHKTPLMAIARRYTPQRSQPLLPLKLRLEWNDIAKIELHKLEYPRLFIQADRERFYPLKEKAAHLIGYMGAVSKEEQGTQPLLRLPDFKIGKSGIEKMLESELRGDAGLRQSEVDAHGLTIRELKREPSTAGKEIVTSIDADMQVKASDLLGEESGAIVLMDCLSGEILAMSSMPGFDPNIFSTGIPHSYWQSLQTDPRNPLLNKATQGQYPPGSTFKMIVGLAGLEANIITTSSSIACPGYYYLGNHMFRCWKKEGHGYMNIRTALTQSCDTFFYTVAHKTGITRIADMCHRLGLGQTHLPGYVSEKSGIVPDPEWKRRRFNQSWQAGDTVNIGIGQGYVLATPLQLAIMTARMVTGQQVIPSLRKSMEAPSFKPLDISPAYLESIRAGMHDVTMSARGTAYTRRILQPEFAMAGKTGTSQVRRIIEQGVDQDKLPREQRHHGLFVGYAPLDTPRYVASVIVEHGGGGGSAAAPRARDILLAVQQKYHKA